MHRAKFVLVLLPGLAAFGCAGHRPTYPAPPEAAPAGVLVLEPGTLETKSRKYRAEFGSLVVPESRSNPGSRLITIPVIRVPAADSSRDAEPIFLLEGGPGLTNMGWRPRDVLLANHDLVMVGYRGVDGSSVLDCPEVEEAMKGDGDLLGERSLRTLGAAWSRCAARLRDSGVDLNGYTILDVVEDLEAARQALGYDRIDLLSLSYGTRVAYVYALRYPASVCRSVMIGANPPGHMVWEPADVDRLLRRYADRWAQDPRMRARSADLTATMQRALAQVPRRWFLFGIDPGKVRVMTFLLLNHKTSAPLVFDAYIAAEKGDASGFALMTLAFDRMFPSMMCWGDLASKAVSADFDSLRDYVDEMEPPGATLGSPLGKLLWGPLRYGAWPIRPLPDDYRALRRSDVPTLLISGDLDPATPAEFAENELLPHLGRGRHVVFSGMGHVDDTWRAGGDALQRLLTSFYDTGIANDSLITPSPLDFSVKRGFPKLAKLGLGVAVGGVLLVGGGLAWLVISLAR